MSEVQLPLVCPPHETNWARGGTENPKACLTGVQIKSQRHSCANAFVQTPLSPPWLRLHGVVLRQVRGVLVGAVFEEACRGYQYGIDERVPHLGSGFQIRSAPWCTHCEVMPYEMTVHT